MIVLPALALSLVASPAAACPGELAAAEPASAASIDSSVAHHVARRAALLGNADAAATALAARRVVREGQEWTWAGHLRPAALGATAEWATPFQASATDGGPLLLGTELVELLVNAGASRRRLSLAGRVLDIDGQPLAVVTSYRVLGA